MVKTSAHDCFRICVKKIRSAAGRDGRELLRLERHHGNDVFEGVKARQHGEDLLRPVSDLGQLQRHGGVDEAFAGLVAGRKDTLSSAAVTS